MVRAASTEAQHLIIGLFGSTSSNHKLVRSVGGPLLSVVPQRVSQKWLVMYTLHKSWHHSLRPPARRKIPGKTACAEQLLAPELSLYLTPTVPAEMPCCKHPSVLTGSLAPRALSSVAFGCPLDGWGRVAMLLPHYIAMHRLNCRRAAMRIDWSQCMQKRWPSTCKPCAVFVCYYC